MRREMLALSALMLTAGTAFADTVPKATQDFIDKAAVANKFEIDTSQLELKYGKGAEVKSFAQQMIDDHTKAGQEFKASLAEAKIEAPKDELDITHTAKYAKLRVFTTESGFDAAYADVQLQAHKEAVGLFKDYSANGPAGPVKTFAEKTLPTLEHHLMMAKDLNAKLNSQNGASGASSGTSGDVKH
jgi:putative membrane protein